MNGDLPVQNATTVGRIGLHIAGRRIFCGGGIRLHGHLHALVQAEPVYAVTAAGKRDDDRN